MLNGSIVAQGIGNPASNQWVNYSPCRTTVTDGLNIGLQHETMGNPMIANCAVFHAPEPVALADVNPNLGIAPASPSCHGAAVFPNPKITS